MTASALVAAAACLLLAGGLVAALAPPVLVRLTRAGATPRLGVMTWLIAVAGVAGAWTAAGLALLAAVALTPGHTGMLLDACLTLLRGLLPDMVATVSVVSLMMLTGLAALRLVRNLASGLATCRRQARRHAEAVRLVGRRHPLVDAVVLDAADRMVYCLPGRPHTIVVTSGALDVLDTHELAAVLAHEHAHLTGRHHLLLTVLRAIRRSGGRLRLFNTAAAQVARLLEMRADDVAARRHNPATVARALLSLSTHPTPAATLPAAGPTAALRAIRLLDPPRRLLRALIALAQGGTAVALAAVLILGATVPVLGMSICPFPGG